MNKRIEREKKTVSLMIAMYCRQFHELNQGLCEHCAELNGYALMQTENCRFGEKKFVCSACPVHCYRRDRREQIRKVMKYSGPRILFHHPFYAITHSVDKKKDEFLSHKFKTIHIK